MLHAVVTAGLQDVIEADDVGLDVGVRVVDAVPHTGLGRQVHHDLGVIVGKDLVDEGLVGDGATDEDVAGLCRLGRLLDAPKAVLLQGGVIVVVHIVQTDNGAAGEIPQQPQHQKRPDEAGGAGDQNGFAV